MSLPRFPYPVLVGLAVAVMAACVWAVGQTQRGAATRSFQQTEHAQAMLTALVEQETGLRGFRLNRRREFLAPYFTGERTFDHALAAARDAGGGRDVAALLDRSEELARRWRASAQRTLRGDTRRAPLVHALHRKELMDAFRETNARLRDELAQRRSAELSRATTLSVALIVALSALFGGGAWLLVGRPLAAQRRRDTRRIAVRERQSNFARALQMSSSEDEAHGLLERHLEATLDGADVAVLARERDADRLRAAGPCVAVRLGEAHEEGEGTAALLDCALCGSTGRPRSLCSPLLVSGEIIGAVRIGHDKALDDDEREQVDDSVSQAAPVIANLRNLAIAQERAATDALTGLANRRALNDTLHRTLAQTSRAGGSLSLIALDLDGFKQINDLHGHEKGDQVLAATAAALTGTLRASDFVARSGGEEFVVLLPDTGLAGALAVAENLRAALQVMAVPGLGAPVTGSFGVAVHPEDAPDGPELLRRADRALYLAKRNGRNRVEAAASIADPPPLA